MFAYAGTLGPLLLYHSRNVFFSSASLFIHRSGNHQVQQASKTFLLVLLLTGYCFFNLWSKECHLLLHSTVAPKRIVHHWVQTMSHNLFFMGIKQLLCTNRWDVSVTVMIVWRNVVVCDSLFCLTSVLKQCVGVMPLDFTYKHPFFNHSVCVRI